MYRRTREQNHGGRQETKKKRKQIIRNGTRPAQSHKSESIQRMHKGNRFQVVFLFWTWYGHE